MDWVRASGSASGEGAEEQVLVPLLKVMLSVLVSTVGTATDPADDVENWKDLHDVGLLTGGMIAAAGAAWIS